MCITDTTTRLMMAAPVAHFGGGSGVFNGVRAYGAGGGGYAAGGPGNLGALFAGQLGCSGVTGGGGAGPGSGGRAAVMGPLAVYNGGDGALGQTQCPGARPGIMAAWVGGGGGQRPRCLQHVLRGIRRRRRWRGRTRPHSHQRERCDVHAGRPFQPSARRGVRSNHGCGITWSRVYRRLSKLNNARRTSRLRSISA
jgi:hypothetical protein